MSVITKISAQKDHLRVNLYLDGKFAFGITKEALISFQLYKGQEISAELVGRLQGKDFEDKIWQKLLHFISFRPRSIKEVRQKLADLNSVKSLSREQQDNFLQRLTKLGYLDDLAFSKWWMEQRLRQGKGMRLITLELRSKGISTEIIEELKNMELPNQGFQIQALISKYFVSLRKEPPKIQQQKLAQYLLRRGFTWEEAAYEVKLFLTKQAETDMISG